MRGSADYRRRIIPGLVARAVDAARARAAAATWRGAASVSLTVNGDPLALLAGPGATLLDMLRSQAQLTGSKQGCNSGVCGACTALVDGKTARACLILAADCAGRSVVTVEGLDDDPHAVFLREEMAAARRGAVRLLHAGHRRRPDRPVPQCGSAARRRGPAPMPGRQYLPLHRLCQHRRGRAARGPAIGRRRGGRAAAVTGLPRRDRPVAAAPRRRRQTGRRGALYGRPYPAGYAARRHPRQPLSERAHPRHRHGGRQGAARSQGGAHERRPAGPPLGPVRL